MKLSSDQFNINFLDERLIWFLLLVILSMVSCGESEEQSDYIGITGLIEQLPQLPESHEYAMWLLENGNTRLMTSFNADDDGIFRLASAPLAQFIADMTEVIVSIEESDDPYVQPTSTQILGAGFSSQDQSNFETYTIASDFSTASAVFEVESNIAGAFATLRFVTDQSTSLFSLPNLNDGWTYEMWVQNGNEYESLFRFDADGVPEIYEHNEDLENTTLLISVEPLADYSAAPTGMFLFSGVIELTSDLQELNNTDELLPVGVITREK